MRHDMAIEQTETNPMRSTNDGIRKAAVFVAALDCSAADALLERLPELHARRVREAVVALQEVDSSEQRRVRDEFLRVRSMVPKPEPAGIELDGTLARLVASARTGALNRDETAEHAASPPFAFLSDTAGGDLADALQSERPQTIALVLAHLPPRRASDVLSRLDSAGQADVIRRLASLEETNPEVVFEVEQALQSRVARQWGISKKRVVGMKAVEDILRESGPTLSQTIARTLGTGKGSPEEPHAEPAIRFEELPRMDTGSLITLFGQAGRPLAAAALLGAPAALVNRVLGSLPRAESQWLRRQLDAPGPIRLRDVEEARRRIAQLATELRREGRIGPGSNGSRLVLTG